MGIIKKTLKIGLLGATTGVAGVGAGMAYLVMGTTLEPVPKDDPWLKTRTYRKYNPKANPALQDDCIKRVPLSKIPEHLRNDERALTLEFCRGIWSGWGYWAQSKFHERYDKPLGTENYTWKTSDLAVAKYGKGFKFSNHFEVVENKGHEFLGSGSEITVRCGGSPLNPGLRNSDGLVLISGRIDREKQEAVFSLKSALFSSAGTAEEGDEHPIPPKITFLHKWYVRMLVQSGVGKVLKPVE